MAKKIFKDLVFGFVDNGVGNFRPNLYRQGDKGNLIYNNDRSYKSVLVHWAEAELEQQAIEATRKLTGLMKNRIKDKINKDAREQQDAIFEKIEELRKGCDEGVGKVKLKGVDGDYVTIKAYDQYGGFVPESLIMYYKAGRAVKTDYLAISDNIEDGKKLETRSFSSKYLHFIDLAPTITLNSNKNIVLTQVQGRDYTRKELVGGGDLHFSVSGAVTSPYAGVYPSEQVEKLIEMMSHNGVIQVNHYIFKRSNVSQVLIRNFKLEQAQFKNVQPYSFECVAIEPDDAVKVGEDTITLINMAISEKKLSGFEKFILKNKYADMVTDMATDLAVSAIHSGVEIADKKTTDILENM